MRAVFNYARIAVDESRRRSSTERTRRQEGGSYGASLPGGSFDLALSCGRADRAAAVALRLPNVENALGGDPKARDPASLAFSLYLLQIESCSTVSG